MKDIKIIMGPQEVLHLQERIQSAVAGYIDNPTGDRERILITFLLIELGRELTKFLNKEKIAPKLSLKKTHALALWLSWERGYIVPLPGNHWSQFVLTHHLGKLHQLTQ